MTSHGPFNLFPFEILTLKFCETILGNFGFWQMTPLFSLNLKIGFLQLYLSLKGFTLVLSVEISLFENIIAIGEVCLLIAPRLQGYLSTKLWEIYLHWSFR